MFVVRIISHLFVVHKSSDLFVGLQRSSSIFPPYVLFILNRCRLMASLLPDLQHPPISLLESKGLLGTWLPKKVSEDGVVRLNSDEGFVEEDGSGVLILCQWREDGVF